MSARSSQVLWCMQSPRGVLLLATISKLKHMAVFRTFPLMSSAFQSEHWKNEKTTAAAYRRLGYRPVRVRVVVSGKGRP